MLIQENVLLAAINEYFIENVQCNWDTKWKWKTFTRQCLMSRFLTDQKVCCRISRIHRTFNTKLKVFQLKIFQLKLLIYIKRFFNAIFGSKFINERKWKKFNFYQSIFSPNWKGIRNAPNQIKNNQDILKNQKDIFRTFILIDYWLIYLCR